MEVVPRVVQVETHCYTDTFKGPMQLINSCISSAKKWLQLLPCDWNVVSPSDSLDLTLDGCIWQIITHPVILTCWKTFQGLLCAGLVFLSLWLSGAPFLCVCLPQEKHLGSAALTWGCVKGGRSWGLDLLEGATVQPDARRRGWLSCGLLSTSPALHMVWGLEFCSGANCLMSWSGDQQPRFWFWFP